MPSLRDLGTVVIHPQETMERILADRDRWVPQVVILASVCASVQDSTMGGRIAIGLPGIGYSAVALVALSLIGEALAWLIVVFLLAWIGAFAGRKMGGATSAANVRAALAWGLVPLIYSPLYKIPFALMARRLQVDESAPSTTAILEFFGGGGCSIIVAYLALQLVFMIWCVWVGSLCLAEAQQFTPAKGFANVAITLAVPLVVIAAVVAASHF